MTRRIFFFSSKQYHVFFLAIDVREMLIKTSIGR